MDDTALFEQIIAKLRIKADVTEVITCLDEFLSTFFSPKTQTDLQPLFDKLPNGLSKILKDALLKEVVTPENQNAIKKKIETLEEKLRSLKSIQITMAVQPDEEAITLFSDWVKKNVGPQTLIDLQFDKTIVGGALIIAEGRYKDYSVRKTLADKFQIQREEIVKLLN